MQFLGHMAVTCLVLKKLLYVFQKGCTKGLCFDENVWWIKPILKSSLRILVAVLLPFMYLVAPADLH